MLFPDLTVNSCPTEKPSLAGRLGDIGPARMRAFVVTRVPGNLQTQMQTAWFFLPSSSQRKLSLKRKTGATQNSNGSHPRHPLPQRAQVDVQTQSRLPKIGRKTGDLPKLSAAFRYHSGFQKIQWHTIYEYIFVIV